MNDLLNGSNCAVFVLARTTAGLVVAAYVKSAVIGASWNADLKVAAMFK